MLALHLKMGDKLTEKMRTFFPVIVYSNQEDSKGECIDVIWIDREAKTPDFDLLQAVVNGQEIETLQYEDAIDSEFNEDKNTIDI